ncbi:hypothetical protein HYU50_01470 [Candidatus Woesearchaeota archaeon]|nr:hypothetical protein [Candidatus Woesearchaeota archaeon]
MKKVHTKIKRKFRLSTRFRHSGFFHQAAKKNGPKTFKTESAAHAWASSHGLKPEQYALKSAKRNKRFQIVLHG